MTRKSLRVVTAAALIGWAGGFAALQAGAQSDAELRRENQLLRQQVEELQKELDAANERIQRLEEEVRRLRESGGPASRPPSVPPEEEKISIDESKPAASPRALLKALQKDYQEYLGEIDRGEPDSRERAQFMRALELWRGRIMREARTRVEWTVTLVRVLEWTDRSTVVEMQMVDPKFGTEIGDPFRAVLPRREADTVERAGLEETYLVRGVVLPQITINPDAVEPGPFNYPKLAGPFAEFSLTMEAQTVVPVAELRRGDTDRDRGRGGGTTQSDDGG